MGDKDIQLKLIKLNMMCMFSKADNTMPSNFQYHFSLKDIPKFSSSCRIGL